MGGEQPSGGGEDEQECQGGGAVHGLPPFKGQYTPVAGLCYADLVMIRVRWYNLLAERSLSGREEYEVPFEEGLRPVDLIRREGFHGEEEQAIVVLVNEEQASRETPLSDGDRVELMINMVGG